MKLSIPAGRFAKPEEIAYAALFLCSEYASYINGINLPIDGGRTKSL
jgi:3-oxoacyl-[acyl-carrier protein] reductase